MTVTTLTTVDAAFVAALVTTGQAAKDLGIAPSTLTRWVEQGLVEPDLTTAGGHYRWDVDRLRRALRDLAARDRTDRGE